MSVRHKFMPFKIMPPVNAKRGKPQTPSAEDKNDDLAREDRVYSTTSCGLKNG